MADEVSSDSATTRPYTQQKALITEDVVKFGAPRYKSLGDLQKGGQNGVGVRNLNVDGATPQPFPPLRIVMLHSPEMWNNDVYRPLAKQHKAIWEQHAKTIDGVGVGYQVDTHDLPYGHDGQQYSMPMNNKRNPVSPSLQMDEVYGNIGWAIHYLYLKHLCHPDTCASILSAIRGDVMPPWVWSTFTFSILCIQPDSTGLYNRILDSWVITNMWPTETGDIGSKMELGSWSVPQRSFPHKGVVVHNENTRELGRLVYSALNIQKVNYDYQNTYTGIDNNLTDYGIQGTIKECLNDFQFANSGDDAAVESNAWQLGKTLEATTSTSSGGNTAGH